MSTLRWVRAGLWGLGLSGMALACSSGSSAPTTQEGTTGSATFAIAVVPSNVTCIQINAVGTTTLQQSYPIAPSGSSVLTMTGLPVGSVAFQAFAYQMNTTSTASCTGISASTVPTWFSNTVTANINGTSATALTLEMTQNGQGLVTVDFPDAGTPVDGGDAAVDAPVVPTITIESPTTNTYANAGPVPVQIATTGMIPSSVDLLVDGVIWTTMTSPFSFTLNAGMLNPGTHSLVASGHFGLSLIASPPVTLIIDRTQPTIVSRVPAPGATNVHVADPITVTFSNPMSLASLNGAGVVLTMNGAPIPFTTTLSTDLKTATFTPTGPTDGSATTTLGLSLNSAVTSASGNPLSGSIFSWSWQAPQIVTYPIPTLPVFTSPAAGTTLSLYPDWQMASPSVFEFDFSGNWNNATFTTVPQQLFTETAGAWTSLGAAPAVTLPTGMTPYITGWVTLGPTGGITLEDGGQSSTATTGAGQRWYATSTWTGAAWTSFAQITTNFDPTYGYYTLDAAGNAYAKLTATAQTNFYKRTGGIWALWTTVPVVTGTWFQTAISPSGTLYVARFPGTLTSPTAGTITVTSFNGVGTTTLVSGANPINAAAVPNCQLRLDTSGNPRLDCELVTTSASNFVGAAYSFSIGAGTWTAIGGGAIGPTLMQPTAGSYYYQYPTFVVDRFGRTQAQITGSTDGVSVQYYVVDLIAGKWGTPILIDGSSTCPTGDLVCSFSSAMADDVNNTTYVDMHGTADSTGLKVTVTGTARVINR